MISLKQIKECDIQMVSKNLSISTCPIEEVFEAPPPPREFRIDIRMVLKISISFHSEFSVLSETIKARMCLKD